MKSVRANWGPEASIAPEPFRAEDAKMKRMLLTLAVVGLAVGAAQADWGGFVPPAPQ